MGKKKSSGKRKTQRKGLSGNPQRRAGQLAAERAPRDSDLGSPFVPEAAYPKLRIASWWDESHERVLAAARAADWPSDRAGIEARAGEIIGDEFYERINDEGKDLHAVHWPAVLAARTGREFRAAFEQDRPEWRQLWGFLQGLALTMPRQSMFAEGFDQVLARMAIPLDADPYEVAQAETVSAAALLASRGLVPDPVIEDGGITLIEGLTVPYGAETAGDALFARDIYGSRFVVTAPFGYRGTDAGRHWYAWDIDTCGSDIVVGAGAFGSAEEALAEWREAVGAPAASEAALEPCPESAYLLLLDSLLETGPDSDVIDGHEPRGFVREFWRMRQRARALAWGAGRPMDEIPAFGQAYDYSPDYREFQAWHAERHPDLPEDWDQDLASVLHHWGPPEHLDAASFYACSPHRIKVAGIVISESYAPEYANAALRLLPDWTRWCLTRGGHDLDSDLAARALETAHAEAANLVTGEGSPRSDSGWPFRHPES